jgi:hypothetical protein
MRGRGSQRLASVVIAFQEVSDDIARIDRALAFAHDLHVHYGTAGCIGDEPLHVGSRQQRQIRMCDERRIDADNLRIGLVVGQAWIPVKGVAADTGRVGQRLAVTLVEQDTHGQMEWMQAFAFKPIEQLSDPRFMAQRGICVRLLCRRLAWVLAAQSVDVKKLFGPDNTARTSRTSPGFRRNAVGVPDFLEILFAQP